MSRSLFDRDRAVYWPAEYLDLVNLLKGLGPGEKAHAPFYKFNTGVIALAAIVGLAHDRQRDIGPLRQQISTDTFASHRFGNVSLDTYIFMVPLLASNDTELLKSGREEEVIRQFERYAAGGLEILQDALSASSDSTGMSVMMAEIERALSTEGVTT